MWADQNFRAEEERFLRAALRPGETVIDAGANIGSTALACAVVVGSSGRVVAIEPHPRIFTYLKLNISRNAAYHVEAIQCALGRESGVVHFSDRRSDDQNSIASNGQIKVPIERLDDIAPEGRISLLKVDVEGYEYHVFKGAENTLARTDMVYFEYVPGLARDGIADAPWQPLIDIGFNIYENVSGALTAAHLPPMRETMLIALKDTRTFAERTGLVVAGAQNSKSRGEVL
jgi:FkbM family methyltransferase